VPARRFFVAGAHEPGASVAIEGADAHKILHVLRLRDGDRIDAVDSAGTRFDARLHVDGSAVHAVLERLVERLQPAPVAIDVAQGIPKGAKMDYVVEKLGELGVRTLVPLHSERAVAQDVREAKVQRWRRLAESASRQSGRADILQIEQPCDFDALCARMAAYDLVLMPWEASDRQPLGDRLPALLRDARRVLIVIGPEGGFSHAEAERAEAAGATLVSLGSRILRTETAALATVAVLWYELERCSHG
jgi:16S rRNA (uracil1498-N3)-methyltransferase